MKGTPVVVGVDGSPGSLAAVELAAREAALRGVPLRVVHALAWPYLDVPLASWPYAPSEPGLRRAAERTVAEAVERARKAEPDLTVDADVVTGDPGPVLLSESRTAALVVVGDRGLGGFTGLLLGSVAVQLATNAVSPVLVARGTARPGGPVLLGVDGSAAGQSAVGMAFAEADLHGVPLLAVHTWTRPVSTGPGDMLPLVYDADEVEADGARVLAEALAGSSDMYPDVVVHRQLVRGHPRQVLIEATSRAQLAVVGSRGRGGFAGLLLGSVSQAVLHHAGCPVAIVPHADDRY